MYMPGTTASPDIYAQLPQGVHIYIYAHLSVQYHVNIPEPEIYTLPFDLRCESVTYIRTYIHAYYIILYIYIYAYFLSAYLNT